MEISKQKIEPLFIVKEITHTHSTMNSIKRILPLYNKDLIESTSETIHKNITMISSYINKTFDNIIEADNQKEECFIDPEDHCYDIINVKIDSHENEKNNECEYELREIKIIS